MSRDRVSLQQQSASYAGRVVRLLLLLLCINDCCLAQCWFGSQAGEEGDGCLLPCRCPQGDCDPDTGRCLGTGECGETPLVPWSGHGCQVGNLAYGRRDIHINHNPSGDIINSDLTVDGDLNTCVLIDTNDPWETPQWDIDLGSNFSIQKVEIHINLLDGYDRDRFRAKFTVDASESAGLEPRTSCGVYEDILPVTNNITIDCSFTDTNSFRYVRIRRGAVGLDIDPRPGQLALCEVVIVGHPYLDIDCDHCIQQQLSSSGQCGNGIWCEQCEAGYTGLTCYGSLTDGALTTPVSAFSTTSTVLSPSSTTSTSVPPSTTVTASTLSTSATTISTSTPAPATSAVAMVTSVNVTSRTTSSTSVPTTESSVNDSTTELFPSSSVTITSTSSLNVTESRVSNTSQWLIIYTVVGIFAVILVTLVILALCVCLRRRCYGANKYANHTPNSTLRRGYMRRSLNNNNMEFSNGAPQGLPYDEEYIETSLSRRSSMLDMLEVMDTIQEEEEKKSSKHSSNSSLVLAAGKGATTATSATAAAVQDGSNSHNGSVSRRSNRSL